MKLIKNLNESGSALLTIVIIMPFLILIISYFMDLAVSNFNLARGDQYRTHAQFATDAGTDYAVQQINEDDTWTGTLAPIEVHNDGSIKTTFDITIEDVDADTKTITSVGKSYFPVNATTPKSTITIKTDLRAVTSGNFSIVTGVGGLYMSNSSKILGGDVYVNGEISMSNSSQIGLSSNPVTLKVAHQVCPIPATALYPQICGSGNGEPITINHTAHIYGDVEANNQTTTSGMTDPGLTASSGVPALPLPTHDRDAQKAAVATTITGAAASCNGSQTRTYAANTKITGNVTIRNNCVVTVEGDVWITGSLSVENSAIVKVADSAGTTKPNIMIDSASGASFTQTATLQSNADTTGFQILAYYSRASCSPDCADVTGTDLYASRNDTTISLNQSASGPNTIFYSRWSRVTVFNSGQIGALVGQTIQLTNSGTITFGTSVPGSGTTGWVIDKYRRTFN